MPIDVRRPASLDVILEGLLCTHLVTIGPSRAFRSDLFDRRINERILWQGQWVNLLEPFAILFDACPSLAACEFNRDLSISGVYLSNHLDACYYAPGLGRRPAIRRGDRFTIRGCLKGLPDPRRSRGGADVSARFGVKLHAATAQRPQRHPAYSR